MNAVADERSNGLREFGTTGASARAPRVDQPTSPLHERVFVPGGRTDSTDAGGPEVKRRGGWRRACAAPPALRRQYVIRL
jgi:hypothetical protein